MDISKLPKLSNTREQEAVAAATPTGGPPTAEVDNMAPVPGRPPVPDYAQGLRQPGVGTDIWINLVIGVLLLYVGRPFFHFLVAKITHQPFHTGVNWTDGPNAGAEVGYWQLDGHTAWQDMGIFLFALVLLFEAVSKGFLIIQPGKASRAVLGLSIALTAGALVVNLIACVLIMNFGLAPLLNGLAVAFGGWVLFDEIATMRLSLLLAGRK